jgi:hypothetical protein
LDITLYIDLLSVMFYRRTTDWYSLRIPDFLCKAKRRHARRSGVRRIGASQKW